MSQALVDFKERLDEVQQLVDAHGALVRLKKADAAAAGAGGGGLTQALAVIQALVSKPKRGRPPEVQALNAGAVALLSAHLQGFVVDLFAESARALLGGHVPSIDAMIDAASTRGNPNEHNINKLFAAIGFKTVIDGLSWRRVSNDALRKKLRAFNELRNRIVHGKSETVHKKYVVIYMSVWKNFAEQLDAKLAREIRSKTGKAPW